MQFIAICQLFYLYRNNFEKLNTNVDSFSATKLKPKLIKNGYEYSVP